MGEIILSDRVVGLLASLQENTSNEEVELHSMSSSDAAISRQKVEKTLRDWVAVHGVEATCEELLPLLRENGFNQLAAYLEQCITEVPRIKCSEDYCETKPLLQSSNPSVEKSHSNIGISEDEKLQIVKYKTRLRISKQLNLILFVSLILTLISCGVLSAILILQMNNCKLGIYLTPHELRIENNATSKSDHVEIAEATEFTSTEPTTLSEDENFCVPENLVNSNYNESEAFKSTMPNWNAHFLDFCHDEETQLLILGNRMTNKTFPTVLCPEKVVSLEIYLDKNRIPLKYLLKTFCRVRTISFFGTSTCFQYPLEYSDNSKQLAASIKKIRWMSLSACGNIIKDFTKSLSTPHLIYMEFECSAFNANSLTNIDRLADAAYNFTSITCTDNRLCEGFQLHTNKSINIFSNYKNCE